MVFANCVEKMYMQNYKEVYCSGTQITFLHCIGDHLKTVFTPNHCKKTE
jgi:hypothetical protein